MPPEHGRRALWVAALVACLGVVWAIWSAPLVMTNDGPEAVLTAHMEAHYEDPESIFQRQFSVGFGLSGRGFSVLYRPIAAIVSFPNSFRVSQVVMVLALAFAFAWLSNGLSSSPHSPHSVRLAPLLGFAIAFSWPFYMGFFAFTISMAVGLMVVAFVVSKPRGLTVIEKAAVSTALVVQLFLHGFAVFIALSLITLVVMTRALMQRKSAVPAEWRRTTLADAGWLVASAIPSVVVLLVMRTAQPAMAKMAGAGTTDWASLSDWAKVFPRLVVPGSTTLGIVVFVLALLGIARTALRVRRQPRKPEDVALLIGATGLLLAALVLPLNIPGWQFFAPRFLTTGLALSLCLLGSEDFERRPLRIAFELGAVGLVIAVLVNARALHRRLATACEDSLAGLEHKIERKGFQLPITFDANCGLPADDTLLDVPYSRADLHFYALFPVHHGGTVPYGFFGPAAVHAFVPRAASPVPIPPFDRYWGLAKEDARLTFPPARAGLLTDLAVYGTHYENILFFGATAADRALLLDRGYVIDFEHGTFVNAHHVPCVVELVSDINPGDPPVMVRGGVRDDELWTARIGPVPERRAIKASLSTLCGDEWVRVEWQNSTQRCANADERGRIALHARPGSTSHLVCERSVP
jgi:hypothetical protein